MNAWKSVKDDPPGFDEKVLVRPSENSNEIYAAVRRWENDGWFWEQYHMGGDLMDDANYEWDDDYQYDKWTPFPGLSEPDENKK